MFNGFAKAIKKLWFGNGVIILPPNLTPVINENVKTLGNYTLNEVERLVKEQVSKMLRNRRISLSHFIGYPTGFMIFMSYTKL
jgi:hypothetical protein